MGSKARGVKMMKNMISLFISAAFLSACSNSSESFDTPPGKGVGSRSISDVNKMVDEGKIKGIPSSQDSVIPPVITVDKPSVDFISSCDSKVIRIPAEHMRVWVTPYQDDLGNFHEGSIVHTLLNQGTWHMFSPSH